MTLGTVQSKVLIVGCSPDVSVPVCVDLGARGVSVVAQALEDLGSTLASLEPDVVVMALPDMDALELIRSVRRLSNVPLIVLIPRKQISAARLDVFEAGADYILPLPLDPVDLRLQVEAILRRRSVNAEIRVGDVVIDAAAHRASRDGHEIGLTMIEYELLEMLARRAGTVVGKRELLAEIWGFEDFDVNLVEVHVSSLRRKLEAFGPRVIETVRCHGYVIRRDPAPAAVSSVRHWSFLVGSPG